MGQGVMGGQANDILDSRPNKVWSVDADLELAHNIGRLARVQIDHLELLETDDFFYIFRNS